MFQSKASFFLSYSAQEWGEDGFVTCFKIIRINIQNVSTKYPFCCDNRGYMVDIYPGYISIICPKYIHNVSTIYPFCCDNLGYMMDISRQNVTRGGGVAYGFCNVWTFFVYNTFLRPQVDSASYKNSYRKLRVCTFRF